MENARCQQTDNRSHGRKGGFFEEHCASTGRIEPVRLFYAKILRNDVKFRIIGLAGAATGDGIARLKALNTAPGLANHTRAGVT